MKVNNGKNLFVKNILNALSANLVVAFVGLINSFVFPKILSVADYAYYHTFTLYIGYLGLFHLGFPTGMAIKYAGKDYDSIEKKHYKSELLILYSIIMFFFWAFFCAFSITKNKMLLYITLVIIPTCIIGSYKSLLQAWNRFKEYRVVSVILSVSIPIVSLGLFFVLGELTGDLYIIVYLIINWIVTFYVVSNNYKETKDVRLQSLFLKDNFLVGKVGFGILIGSYINVLLTSADKQFVRWFFKDSEFAFFSFGMSMQSLMTVFIGSIAQPLFPKMAETDFKEENINMIKDLLLIFGSLSGVAYFGASFIVNCFLPHYKDSLNVVSIYFVVFPVYAVVSCLYVNLYKIKGMTKQYISTLVLVLVIDVILNFLLILCFKQYVMVAIATTLVYFVWFLIGIKQFSGLNLT